MNEGSESGAGFLADVCREWEIATEFIGQTEIRVVNLRMGIVLSLAGGPLEKMLPPFKMGAGGTLGNGQQYMSWITLDDAVSAIHHILVTDSLQGPVNNVAPHPVTNREFTKALGRVLRRPTLFPSAKLLRCASCSAGKWRMSSFFRAPVWNLPVSWKPAMRFSIPNLRVHCGTFLAKP